MFTSYREVIFDVDHINDPTIISLDLTGERVLEPHRRFVQRQPLKNEKPSAFSWGGHHDFSILSIAKMSFYYYKYREND